MACARIEVRVTHRSWVIWTSCHALPSGMRSWGTKFCAWCHLRSSKVSPGSLGCIQLLQEADLLGRGDVPVIHDRHYCKVPILYSTEHAAARSSESVRACVLLQVGWNPIHQVAPPTRDGN